MIKESAAKNTHNVVEEMLFKPNSRKVVTCNRVLDVPCGDGAFTARLRKRNVTVISGDIVDNIKKYIPEAQFVFVDMDIPFPFEDNSFTDVVCIDGIEHIERQFDFIRECNRVLELNGSVIISTPNISSARSRWRYFLTGQHNKYKSPLSESVITPYHHKSMISFSELRYLLHTNGFRIEEVRTNRIKLISYLYGIVFVFLYLATQIAYNREERDPSERMKNQEIIRTMYSRPVFWGETLIIKAKKYTKLTNHSS